jgi:hypothetical protein
MPDGDERSARPREAFALLGHDLRLAILLALLDRWDGVHTEPQGYSELMRAVGVQDSGKFNYHLGKLRGTYLRKSEAGGYVPTASATALYRAVLAHRPTERVTRSELSPDAECPDCDAKLVAGYELDFFTLRCPACESSRGKFSFPLPKNAFEGRTDREALQTVFDRARAHVGLARRGQCPDCAGTTAVSVRLAGTAEPPVEITCETCTWTVRTGFLLPLLSDSRVTAALSAVGVAVEDTSPLALPAPTTSDAGERQFELRFETDGGVVEVTVDDGLDVLAVTTADRTGYR